jgi:hypothetical protein
LRLAGHEASGYYLVNGKDKFEVVNCNMDRESGDQQLQEETGLNLPAQIVAFDSSRATSNAAGVLTYTRISINVGQAFDQGSGEFVAPVDGIYHFSLSIEPLAQASSAYVRLRVNGDTTYLYAVQMGPVPSGGKVFTGNSVTLGLNAGDRVDSYNQYAGTITAGSTVHNFSGHLLYPL